jgi:NodT family efflux transporter outer membrane factor (OMF) lipoprotein
MIRTWEALIALAHDNVAVQEDGKHIAQARFQAGAAAELDVAQASTLLETTRASIPELQGELTRARNALCTLLNRSSGCAGALITSATGIPAPPPQVAVNMPAELLRRRPDIRSAELRAMAQCDRIGVAKAELYPSFQLFGSIGTRSLAVTGAPSGVSPLLGLFGFGNLIYTFGTSVFWPLLNYPKILDNIKVQDARFQQTLLDYQYTVLKAAQEVEDGIAGFLRTQEAAVIQANAVASAQTAVKLAVVQYREGAVDYMRVVDTERTLLQAQNTLASRNSTVATNLVALFKALGGGWEARPNAPVVAK